MSIPTYLDSRDREVCIEAPFDSKPAPWVVKYYSGARDSEGRVIGWVITYRATSWREAAVWANAYLGTSIRLPADGDGPPPPPAASPAAYGDTHSISASDLEKFARINAFWRKP